MINGKVAIISLIAGLIKKISLNKGVIIQNLIVVVKKKKKVELYLSNYVTKSDVNKGTGFDTLDFGRKTDLSSVKSEVSKLDTDNIKTVRTNLIKLSDAIDNDVVKKTQMIKSLQ